MANVDPVCDRADEPRQRPHDGGGRFDVSRHESGMPRCRRHLQADTEAPSRSWARRRSPPSCSSAARIWLRGVTAVLQAVVFDGVGPFLGTSWTGALQLTVGD